MAPRKSKRLTGPKISPEMIAHLAKEEDILCHLLGLEKKFREHYDTVLKEMQVQRELMDRMWVLSQRYIILTSTGPCCKYPEVYSTPAEIVVLREFNEKMQAIHASNTSIMESLVARRPAYLAFHKVCGELDMRRETPFILGDTFHKPLAFFIELFTDSFKYLHALVLRLQSRAHLLEVEDAFHLEEYKGSLEMSEDFEDYFLNGLTYCKCLSPKPQCKVQVAADDCCKNRSQTGMN